MPNTRPSAVVIGTRPSRRDLEGEPRDLGDRLGRRQAADGRAPQVVLRRLDPLDHRHAGDPGQTGTTTVKTTGSVDSTRAMPPPSSAGANTSRVAR